MNTPRTDEQINGKPCTRFAVLAGDPLRDALIPSEFARQLETELATVTAERDALNRHVVAFNHQANAMQCERDALKSKLEKCRAALEKLASDYPADGSTGNTAREALDQTK